MPRTSFRGIPQDFQLPNEEWYSIHREDWPIVRNLTAEERWLDLLCYFQQNPGLLPAIDSQFMYFKAYPELQEIVNKWYKHERMEDLFSGLVEESKGFQPADEYVAKLAEFDFSGLYISGFGRIEACFFSNCDFSNTEFGEIELDNVFFIGCNLENAVFSENSKCSNLTFQGCNLLNAEANRRIDRASIQSCQDWSSHKFPFNFQNLRVTLEGIDTYDF